MPVGLTRDDILGHPRYQKLSTVARKRVGEILTRAAASPAYSYYMARLKLLLDTKDAPATAQSGSTHARMAALIEQALDRAAKRLEGMTPEQKTEHVKMEERKADAPQRRWETYSPPTGGSYLVDRRDPKYLFVRIKVMLLGDDGTPTKIVRLEDSIEKHVWLPGFSVDLVFVTKPGPDVFEARTDLAGWTTSGNWVGRAESLGHELFHLLGLDDEYDYIEAHAANAHMATGSRLHWFLVQMGRKMPVDGYQGIMGNSLLKPLDRHACQAVGLPIEPCVKERGGVALRRPDS